MDEESEIAAEAPKPWADQHRWILLGLLLVASFLIYAPALQADFTGDDRLLAMGESERGGNPLVAEFQSPRRYLTSHYWAGVQETGQLYRPATIFSFALRHALVGDSPFAAHLANLLLHLLATSLVFFLLTKLTKSSLAALIGTAVFSFHALRSEAVIQVVGRAELLAFSFGASALLLLLRYRSANAVPRIASQLASAALLFLAFCSKESALAWIPFTIVFDLARRQAARENPPLLPRITPRLLSDAVVLIAPLLAYWILREHALSASTAGQVFQVNPLVNPLAEQPFLLRLLNASRILLHGLFLTLAPLSLHADYSANVFTLATEPFSLHGLFGIASFLLLATMLVFGILAYRTRPALFLSVTSFFGFAFLTSNLAIPIGTIFGERLYYTPALGLSFAVLWCTERMLHLAEGPSPHATLLRPVSALALGLWLGASTREIPRRSYCLESDSTLYAIESLRQPDSVRLLLCKAAESERQGLGELAISEYRRATMLLPSYGPAWLYLGRALSKKQDHDAARKALRRAIQRCKGGTKGALPAAYLALARLEETLGHPEAALRYLAELEALQPGICGKDPQLRKLRRQLRRRIGPRAGAGR